MSATFRAPELRNGHAIKATLSTNELFSKDVRGSLRDLKALSHVINESIQQIELTAIDKDLEFPSIDTPYSEESEEIRKDPIVAEAIFNIVSAATRLVAVVRPPPNSILANASLDAIPAALVVAVETHVAEVLREAGSQGLHIDNIALLSDIDPNKLARILRLLANESIFREVSPDVFANNRISSLLDTGKSLDELAHNPANKHFGTSGIAACVAFCAGYTGKALPHLPQVLLDPNESKSYDPVKTAFSRAFNIDKPLFEWLEQKGNEKRSELFGYAMNGYKNLSGMGGLSGEMGQGLNAFPWGKLPSGSVVVDVGGGIGSQTLPIAKAYPELHFVVQDGDQVIKDAEAFWLHEYPEALTSERVKLQANDFFLDQPTKEASVYLIKAVLHDWPDHLCVTILKHIRHAAGPDTKLLISERVISHVCEEGDVYSETSEADIEAYTRKKVLAKPLLPNGGHAMFLAYASDLQMMTLLNGQERTLTQYNSLLDKSGWKLTKVYRQHYLKSSELQILAIPV